MSAAGFASRNELEAFQLERVRALLEETVRAGGFYTRKLKHIDLPSLVSLDEFRRRIPFTTKRELTEDQLESPPYGTILTYPVERYGRFCQTSGTSGRPLRWLDTAESWDWMTRNWMRVFEAAGVTAHDRVFFASTFGPFLGFWLAFEAAGKMGCLCIPGGGMRTSARLHTILDNGVTVLCCTPTYALRLAEVAVEENIDLGATRVRIVIAAGEPGASIPATRAEIERAWNGARVADHHGMTETGPVTYPCPAQSDMLHVIESGYIAEIVAPGGETPALAGARGELVLTPLGRPGAPVFRYRTGDLVQPASQPSPCVCGTLDLALQGGILGRVDDMVVVRGVNVYPSAVDGIVRSVGGVAEYRVEVIRSRTRTDLRLEVEPVQTAEPGLAARVEEAMVRAIGLRAEVALAAPGTLPRFEMKANRWNRTG